MCCCTHSFMHSLTHTLTHYVCDIVCDSGIEEEDCLMADFQRPTRDEAAAAVSSSCRRSPLSYSTESILQPADTLSPHSGPILYSTESILQPADTLSPHSGPIYSTEAIFSPFTKEMDEKYYTCPEIQTIGEYQYKFVSYNGLTLS